MAETAAVGHFLSQAGNRLCFHDMFYTRNSEKYDTSDFKKQYEILKIHVCACKPAFKDKNLGAATPVMCPSLCPETCLSLSWSSLQVSP